jgi:arylsulfatase A-like enzyme
MHRARPRNLIILHADELRGDCVGFAGNREVSTPHLDAFAAQATVLDRHFTVHPKCVPSRVAMMTGRYAHSDGVRTVMEENLLPASQPDLMKTLSAHGYETAVFGLNHCWADFWNGNKPHGMVDWHACVEGDFAAITATSIPVPSPGARPDPPPLADGFDLRGRITTPLRSHSDDSRAACAVHFLEHLRDRTRPFFLQLNISAPHPPYGVEEPWYSQFDPQALTLFPSELPRRVTLPLRAMRRQRMGDRPVDEAGLREVLATYYGMIAKVDMLMGRVLDCIRAQGLLEDSIVVFTSDHGDFAGQYGLCEKFDTVLADGLLRVPCAIHVPGRAGGGRCDALTQHVDLPPTVLELLGIGASEEWNIHGSSLLPVLDGTHRPEAVFADGGHEAPMRRRFNAGLWSRDPVTGRDVMATAGKQHTYSHEPDSMARCSMVRTETHKLVMRETGEHELYDLRADPWELDNRYGEAGLLTVQADLAEQLMRWHLRTVPDRPFQPKVGA